MLTATSELAVRALILLGLRGGETPSSPKALSESLECSPSYLSKTLGQLVKAGLLTSVRGAHGGVLLADEPSKITLFQIVEACQGRIGGDYCKGEPGRPTLATCKFHRVMWDLQERIIETLDRCSLQDLIECPVPRKGKQDRSSCRTWISCADDLMRDQ